MKFDAKRAEHEYITTQTSYRKLAEKYEVSRNAIYDIGSKNGWKQKRIDYQTKLGQRLIEESIEEEVDKLATCKDATNTMLEKVWNMIAEETDRTPQDMRTLAATLKDLIGMKRDLYGLLTKKDELALGKDNTDTNESGVVYIPPLAPESDSVVIEGESNA